jgi:uncharacterized protein YmfQ (DUF2313 family)
MNTKDLLKSLYPPVSYDVNAPYVDACITADAAVLDDALLAATGLLKEVFPDTTTVGLGDWERVYGLPDKCLNAKNTSEAASRAFLLAKINDKGGIRNEDYIARVKMLLGVDVTINEFSARSCSDPCDSALYDEDWRYVWEVSSSERAAVWCRSCTDPCDSQLDYFDNAALECVLKTHAPDGTLPLIKYGA